MHLRNTSNDQAVVINLVWKQPLIVFSWHKYVNFLTINPSMLEILINIP